MPKKKNVSVLIIDKDHFLASVFKYKFEQAGFAARVVSDEKQALEAIRTEEPDVIISETMIGSLSGFELLQQVRAIYENAKQKVYFIFLTRERDNEDLERSKKEGIPYLVMAEMTFDQVVARLRAILRKKNGK